LYDLWIEPLLGHKLIGPKDFKSKQGFFFYLFKEKKLEGKFVLNPTAKVMGYSSFKKIQGRVYKQSRNGK
jgi:dTDP-4-dehydrorhamnose 3,5-epimerase-like enzyme